MLTPTNAARLGRPVTFGEVLGAKGNEPISLNAFKTATCVYCGAEPRLCVTTSPKGREVAVWIPQERCCARKPKQL